MTPARLLAIVCLALGAFAPAWGGDDSLNLLEGSNLTRIDRTGTPSGYKLISKIPGNEEELDARKYVSEDDGSLRLELPETESVRISLLKPVSLESGREFLFSVALKWEDLVATGPGLPAHGPCFIVYVHSATTQKHLVGIIPPSHSSDGWVTLQIPFDTAERPDFESIRILFSSRDVKGTLWLKDAAVRPAEPGSPFNSPQFRLSDGQTMTGAKFSR